MYTPLDISQTISDPLLSPASPTEELQSLVRERERERGGGYYILSVVTTGYTLWLEHGIRMLFVSQTSLNLSGNRVGGWPGFSHGWNSIACVADNCRGEDKVRRGIKANFTQGGTIAGGNVNFRGACAWSRIRNWRRFLSHWRHTWVMVIFVYVAHLQLLIR